MSKNRNSENVKMNLSLDRNFFRLLQREAAAEHMKVTTYATWYLKKHLLPRNKPEKCLIENETM